jgi:hypothetical protein
MDIPFTCQGIAARPYSPCHLKGIRNEAGDLVLTWKRRTRGDGAWKPYVDVVLNETSEAYEVEILAGGVLKRTIAAASPAATYTAAHQIADLGSVAAPGSLTINVYQMSETRGRGVGREMTI